MIRIAIEDVLELQAKRAAINTLPLGEIEWTQNGEVIPITPEQVEDFRFTGLSNTSFVELEFWLGPTSVTTIENGVETKTVLREPQMDLGEAAEHLASHLKGDPEVWSIGVTVGAGAPRIIVYREHASPKVPTEWHGYPVELLISGRPTMF